MVVIYQRLTVTTEQAVEIKFILFIWYEQDDKMNKITVRELRHMNHARLAGYSHTFRLITCLLTPFFSISDGQMVCPATRRDLRQTEIW